MAIEGPQTGDIRATLAISQAEAQTGSSRALNLPGGRRITVPVRAGIRDGEEIRLRGQGEMPSQGGPPGDLILTVSIAPAEESGSQPYYPVVQGGPTEFMPAPTYPPPGSYPGFPNSSAGQTVAATPGYPSSGSRDDFPHYAVPGQGLGQQPLFLNQSRPAYEDPAQHMNYNPSGVQATPAYVPPPQRKKRGISAGITVLILMLVLLLIGVSLFVYYTGVYQPQLHAQATATSQTQVAGTTQAQITGTAQANSQGTANAVNTAQAIGAASATAGASATAAASATAGSLQNIYTQITSSTPTISDPLSAQDSNNWDEFPTNSSGGVCGFSGGTYHSSMSTKGFFQPCYSHISVNNFALQVQMMIAQGDEGGVVFRANNSNSTFYLFRISASGAYDLYVYVDSQGSHARRLLSGSSGLINTGQQSNTITVIARGSNLYFYVNQQYLTSTTDTNYLSGQVALFGESDTNSTDVAFSNLKIWTI
ncbi:MAG TPA: DnaJ C-terminal domain-containing protein [Ktedonobacteraceae bacterium]